MSVSLHIVCPSCLAVNRVAQDRLEAGPLCGACKQSLFTGEPVEVDGAGFARHVSRNAVPVLADFWAPWCGPCRMMAPAFAEAARRLEPRLRVIKLNTEQAPEVSAQFGIRSIPTLLLFRDGKEVARQAGAMNAAGIMEWVRRRT